MVSWIMSVCIHHHMDAPFEAVGKELLEYFVRFDKEEGGTPLEREGIDGHHDENGNEEIGGRSHLPRLLAGNAH